MNLYLCLPPNLGNIEPLFLHMLFLLYSLLSFWNSNYTDVIPLAVVPQIPENLLVV